MVSVGRWVLALSLSALPVAAQTVAAFTVKPTPPVRKGVDAWPLVEPADAPAAQRVNATLTRLNARIARAVKECDADYLDSVKATGGDAKMRVQVSQDWFRKVRVTMAGPRYLSLLALDETNCGGAHPNSSQIALVFDMATGAPLNWMALVPASAGAQPYTDTVADGSVAGALKFPAIHKMSLAKADADCKEALDDESFLLWPDAKQGVIVAQPFDLPFVYQACGDEVDLTTAQARKLGFSETLLQAIDQAHAAAH